MTNTNFDSTIKNGLDNSARELNSTKNHVLSDVKDGFQNISETVRKTGSDALHEVSDVASRAYSQVSDRSGEMLKLVEAEVRNRPLTAIFAAFGAGIAFSMLRRK